MTGGRLRISVIIPVRDRAELLDRCLGALAPRLGDHAEVVVVDDGSRDRTRQVALEWASRHRVRVLDNEGSGAVAARSTGVAASDGEVLAFTDSDCVPSPGWLAAGLAAIDAGADLVQGRTTPERACGVLERSLWVTGDDGLHATCNLFVRRSAFDAAGGFDPAAGRRLAYRAGHLRGLGFGEDTLLGWRIRRSGRAYTFAPDAHVAHHVFAFDARDHIRRSWQAGGFPGLIAEVPELRNRLLVAGLFLGTARRLPLYLTVPAMATGRRGVAAGSAGVWMVWLGREVRRREQGRRRLAALGAGVVADVVTATALVSASVRARSVVL